MNQTEAKQQSRAEYLDRYVVEMLRNLWFIHNSTGIDINGNETHICSSFLSLPPLKRVSRKYRYLSFYLSFRCQLLSLSFLSICVSRKWIKMNKFKFFIVHALLYYIVTSGNSPSPKIPTVLSLHAWSLLMNYISIYVDTSNKMRKRTHFFLSVVANISWTNDGKFHNNHCCLRLFFCMTSTHPLARSKPVDCAINFYTWTAMEYTHNHIHI